MSVEIIVAKDKNNVIGKDGDVPWHIPVDLVRFKEITEGETVIMGRDTFDSIGQPLDNRQNIVLTKTLTKIDGCEVAKSLDEAIKKSKNNKTFIIGGEKPFREGLERADVIHLTEVDGVYEGDTYFPEVDRSQWQVTNWENGADHSYFRLEKK